MAGRAWLTLTIAVCAALAVTAAEAAAKKKVKVAAKGPPPIASGCEMLVRSLCMRSVTSDSSVVASPSLRVPNGA